MIDVAGSRRARNSRVKEAPPRPALANTRSVIATSQGTVASKVNAASGFAAVCTRRPAFRRYSAYISRSSKLLTRSTCAVVAVLFFWDDGGQTGGPVVLSPNSRAGLPN